MFYCPELDIQIIRVSITSLIYIHPSFFHLYRDENVDKWSELLERPKLSTYLIAEHTEAYQPDQICVFLNNISLNIDIVNRFSQKFNIKLIKNMS